MMWAALLGAALCAGFRAGDSGDGGDSGAGIYRRRLLPQQQQPRSHHHRHRIPRHIIFTYKHDLLAMGNDDNRSSTGRLAQNVRQNAALHAGFGSLDTGPVYAADGQRRTVAERSSDGRQQQELLLLADFYDDDGCLRVIGELSSVGLAAAEAEEIQQNFRAEPDGAFKADLCRVAALYVRAERRPRSTDNGAPPKLTSTPRPHRFAQVTGGLYFDVDIVARESLWGVLGEQTDFATVIASRQLPFQAFIASTPQHPLLRELAVSILESVHID
jgi:hypothetical protein